MRWKIYFLAAEWGENPREWVTVMPGKQAKSDTLCVVLGFCRHRKLFYQLWYPYGYVVRVFLFIRGSRFHLSNRILRIARKMVDETKRGARPCEISRCMSIGDESAMGQRIFSCKRLIPLCRRFVGPGRMPGGSVCSERGRRNFLF